VHGGRVCEGGRPHRVVETRSSARLPPMGCLRRWSRSRGAIKGQRGSAGTLINLGSEIRGRGRSLGRSDQHLASVACLRCLRPPPPPSGRPMTCSIGAERSFCTAPEHEGASGVGHVFSWAGCLGCGVVARHAEQGGREVARATGQLVLSPTTVD
jgi:hypothetical protein